MDPSPISNSSTGGSGNVPLTSSCNRWNLTGLKMDWQVSTPSDVHNPPSKLISSNRYGDPTYSPDGSNLVKLIILGAPGVGKTSIIQQFVWGTFEPSYYPTGRKETYYPSVILHEQQYELKIVDIPDLPFFPVNSFYNLSDLQRKITTSNNL
ncbi:GTP-binding protein Di-Ras1 [Lepeophtheirus salmonis]|uniref:GTP-binding protein Di-Ras1 n=1 Tax=Lepeophtheirus salmonis TaxID=72036 RepID=UPI003AF35BA0